MREKVYAFGAGSGLVGVLTEPVAPRPGLPAVLLSNVGTSHRVGPFRLNVALARELAALGFACFRFDFSGLGDSEPARDGRSERERAIAEAGAAMDLVTRRTGATSFVMIGLCSGADKTHVVASADPRIVGTVFIDGYAYTTPRFHVLRLALRLVQWKRIVVAVRERVERLFRPKAEAFRAVLPSPDRAQTERELVALAQRGCRQLHVYTVSTDYIYNYAGQMWDMWPALAAHRGRVVTERFPQIDHTLSMVAGRRVVSARIVKFVCDLASL